MTNPEKNRPNVKYKDIKNRLFRTAIRSIIGKERYKPEYIMGFSEGSIIHSQLCYPSVYGTYLEASRASSSHYLGYDLQRQNFYPELSSQDPDTIQAVKLREGSFSAYMLDELDGKPSDEATRLSLDQLMTFDSILALAKPGLEKLKEEGMLIKRSQEDAYESAGQTEWIPELRMKGFAKDPVYQVAPKAHGLIYLAADGGDKKPKQSERPLLVRLLEPKLAGAAFNITEEA